MTQSKQQRQVFLIYAHSDKQAVRKLYQRITRCGIKTWLDEKELWPGQNWKYEIHQAILGSDIVLVCLSRQFNKQGGFRHEELKIALKKANSLPDDEIFLIPVRLEKCDLPEPVRPWQCVNLFESDGYKKLLKTFRKL
jgi:TIR domain